MKKDHGLVEIKGGGEEMILHKEDKEGNVIKKKIKEKIMKERRG
jgi:hypothetical protein